MTRERALEIISGIGVQYVLSHCNDEEMEALDMAISTLKNNRPKGEWLIMDDCENFTAKCSICGRIEDSRMVNKYPFCHCGADMRGEDK